MLSGIYIWEALCGSKTGYKYVGQSKNIWRRKNDHLLQLRKNNHFNPKLQSYYNKYGPNSLRFEVLILIEKSQLDFFECWFIKSFDSFKNGFNCTYGADKRKGSKRPKKSYNFENFHTGEKITCSQAELCEKYDLISTNVSTMVRGKQSHCFGWFCIDNPWRPETWKVISPTGQSVTIINNCAYFCKTKGLNRNQFARMLRGKSAHCAGWTLINSPFRSKRYVKPFRFQSPEGLIIEGKNMAALGKKIGINKASLSMLSTGKRKTFKGWTLAPSVN